MKRIRALVQQFCSREDGATAIEYGLIAGFIFLVIVAATTQVGQAVRALFEAISAGFKT